MWHTDTKALTVKMVEQCLWLVLSMGTTQWEGVGLSVGMTDLRIECDQLPPTPPPDSSNLTSLPIDADAARVPSAAHGNQYTPRHLSADETATLFGVEGPHHTSDCSAQGCGGQKLNDDSTRSDCNVVPIR